VATWLCNACSCPASWRGVASRFCCTCPNSAGWQSAGASKLVRLFASTKWQLVVCMHLLSRGRAPLWSGVAIVDIWGVGGMWPLIGTGHGKGVCPHSIPHDKIHSKRISVLLDVHRKSVLQHFAQTYKKCSSLPPSCTGFSKISFVGSIWSFSTSVLSEFVGEVHPGV